MREHERRGFGRVSRFETCHDCKGVRLPAWQPLSPDRHVGGVPITSEAPPPGYVVPKPCPTCEGLGKVPATGPTPLRERVRANLEHLAGPRAAEVAALVGSPDLTPAQNMSNLRRMFRGSVYPSPERLDEIARLLGIDVSAFAEEPPE